MPKLIPFLLLMFGCLTFANAAPDPDLEECIAFLKPLGEEKWCSSTERDECIHSHGGFCNDMALYEVQHKALDKRLNSTYRSVMKSIEDDHARESLRTSQKAWLKYHLLECDARTEMLHGGDSLLRNNVWQSCINDFYGQRILELQKNFCQDDKGCK